MRRTYLPKTRHRPISRLSGSASCPKPPVQLRTSFPLKGDQHVTACHDFPGLVQMPWQTCKPPCLPDGPHPSLALAWNRWKCCAASDDGQFVRALTSSGVYQYDSDNPLARDHRKRHEPRCSNSSREIRKGGLLDSTCTDCMLQQIHAAQPLRPLHQACFKQ